jgi:hypothetical protein
VSVTVDLDALAEAFEDASVSLEYYVDCVTGEVILVSETLGFIEAGHQRAAMAEQPNRYFAVPIQSPAERIEELEAFADAADDAMAEKIEAALDSGDPMGRFAKQLAAHDDLAVEWRAFRSRQARERAAQWAAENGFEVT